MASFLELNKTSIHIAVESITIGVITYLFWRRSQSLAKDINELVEKNKKLEDLLSQQQLKIDELTKFSTSKINELYSHMSLLHEQMKKSNQQVRPVKQQEPVKKQEEPKKVFKRTDVFVEEKEKFPINIFNAIFDSQYEKQEESSQPSKCAVIEEVDEIEKELENELNELKNDC